MMTPPIDSVPIGRIPEETAQPLEELPKELPPPGGAITLTNLSQLILPAGTDTDLSRVSPKHPLWSLLSNLWLKVILRAITGRGG